MPDDDLLTRLSNKACGVVTVIGRKSKEQDLRQLRQRIEGLYQQYRPVFVRANRLLAQKGIVGVGLKEFSLAGQNFSLNNNADNQDWGDELAALQDVLSDFTTRTTGAADILASRLADMNRDGEADSLPMSTST